jgi:Na+-transporting NADH:ubiquinone oxidoreductase subunit NqrF
MKRNRNLVLTMLAAGAILVVAACEQDTTVVCSVQVKNAGGTVLESETDSVVVSDGQDAGCDAVVFGDSVGVDPILFRMDSVGVDPIP